MWTSWNRGFDLTILKDGMPSSRPAYPRVDCDEYVTDSIQESLDRPVTCPIITQSSPTASRAWAPGPIIQRYRADAGWMHPTNPPVVQKPAPSRYPWNRGLNIFPSEKNSMTRGEMALVKGMIDNRNKDKHETEASTLPIHNHEKRRERSTSMEAWCLPSPTIMACRCPKNERSLSMHRPTSNDCGCSDNKGSYQNYLKYAFPGHSSPSMNGDVSPGPMEKENSRLGMTQDALFPDIVRKTTLANDLALSRSIIITRQRPFSNHRLILVDRDREKHSSKSVCKKQKFPDALPKNDCASRIETIRRYQSQRAYLHYRDRQMNSDQQSSNKLRNCPPSGAHLPKTPNLEVRSHQKLPRSVTPPPNTPNPSRCGTPCHELNGRMRKGEHTEGRIDKRTTPSVADEQEEEGNDEHAEDEPTPRLIYIEIRKTDLNRKETLHVHKQTCS